MNQRTTSRTDFNSNDAVTRWVRTLAMPMIVTAAVSCTDPQVELRDVVPAEDGFVNPLTGGIGATEANDGDGYYNALDWGEPGLGPNHCGEDWNHESGGSTDYGEPVYATANGTVVSVGTYGNGWGKIIVVKHYVPTAGHADYEYITSVYAHLASYSVQVGDDVARGQQIGKIGDADGWYADAAHLHFEMRWDENLGPTANNGYSCPNEQSGTFDPTDFIDAHPP